MPRGLADLLDEDAPKPLATAMPGVPQAVPPVQFMQPQAPVFQPRQMPMNLPPSAGSVAGGVAGGITPAQVQALMALQEQRKRQAAAQVLNPFAPLPTGIMGASIGGKH